jgi:hypothetical protein
MRNAQAKRATKELYADRIAARPRLRQWHQAIDGAVKQRRMRDFDYRLALHLADYPSANHGRCWPGLDRLAEHFGRDERTIRRSLDRFSANGFLRAERRGLGRTNVYVFLIDGKELFASGEKCQPDWTQMSDQERTQEPRNPLESDPLELNPPQPCGCGEGGYQDRPKEEPPAVQKPPTQTTFNDFYSACRDKRPNDLWGPAWAEWQELSAADRAAIGSHIEHDGRVCLNGAWAVTWLKARKWETSRPETVPKHSPDQPEGWVFIAHGTDEWNRCRDVALAAGRRWLGPNDERDGTPGRWMRRPSQ